MRSLEFTQLDENGNPNLRYIALGESLSGQFLVILGQVGDLNGHVLSKMRGKILGYNNCPCSIFLNLKSKIGGSAIRDLRMEDDWTLGCPKICTRRLNGNGLIDAIWRNDRGFPEMGLLIPSKGDC